MKTTARTRREFLGQVGQGTLMATLGTSLANELGLSPAMADEAPAALNFGPLEPLVCMMQDTPTEKLLPKLTEALRSGTDLRTLVSAAALANARTCGGEDYVGFHTLMAIAPAYAMSKLMPEGQQALPIFKVLYRNSGCIQKRGGRAHEVLHTVQPTPLSSGTPGGEALRDAVRRKDVNAAEGIFASLAAGSPEEAFNQLLYEVQDDTEVHRTALPYRAWDLLGVIGKEHAHALLRQSVRYCVKAESNWAGHSTRDLLPELMEEFHLLDRKPGDRRADDAWVEKFTNDLFTISQQQAARAAAAALADGIAPEDVGECITLAANQLLLRDRGRPLQAEEAAKNVGSVHGNSIGVHACDCANAWRNMARIGNARNTFACLILGAFQVVQDRVRGQMVEYDGDFAHWSPLPFPSSVKNIKTTDPKAVLGFVEDSIKHNLQAHACAAMARYGELSGDPKPAFDLLLRYAVSEDGALHAEKFYQTTWEEFHSTRPAFRWRYLTALARVTASEYGQPAPGMAEARELLKV
jgi:hypothetical protein